MAPSSNPGGKVVPPDRGLNGELFASLPLPPALQQDPRGRRAPDVRRNDQGSSDMENYQKLLDQLKRQEEELRFVEFTNETALQLGLQLMKQAKEEGKALTIDICRNGQQLFHCALAGTSADNDAWIRRKNNVVNRY